MRAMLAMLTYLCTLRLPCSGRSRPAVTRNAWRARRPLDRWTAVIIRKVGGGEALGKDGIRHRINRFCRSESDRGTARAGLEHHQIGRASCRERVCQYV